MSICNRPTNTKSEETNIFYVYTFIHCFRPYESYKFQTVLSLLLVMKFLQKGTMLTFQQLHEPWTCNMCGMLYHLPLSCSCIAKVIDQ